MGEEAKTSNIKLLDELIGNFEAKFFKTLSEPVRMEILRFLMEQGRSDIGTIADHMPQDRSVISRHLNLMHETCILNCEKETRHMFYEINGNAFIGKLEKITAAVRKCMAACCPGCCK